MFMRGDVTTMLVTIILLSSACGFVRSSGIGLAAHPAAAPAPVVTAASSQYFERTFNRLVAAQPALEPVFPVAPPPPVIPVARAPFAPVAPAPTFVPVAPAPNFIPVAPVSPVVPNVIRVVPNNFIPLLPPRPVFVQPTTKDKQEPPAPQNPGQAAASDPNIAIAVATANAAAPVATILLPPYPFGPPPSFSFIPSSPTFMPEDKREKESTTETLSSTQATTTERVSEISTPVPSNIDNTFVQALPSNNNVNFNQYLPPPGLLPLMPHSVQRPQTVIPLPRPQKVKTSVEVVPVPLTYIAPPPLKKHHPLKLVKVTKHIHTFVPTGKIIIRPVSHRIRTVRRPAYIKVYKKPVSAKNVAPYPKAVTKRTKSRDIEPTTVRPFIRPNIGLPRL